MTDTTNFEELMVVVLNSTTAAAINNDYRMPKIVHSRVITRKIDSLNLSALCIKRARASNAISLTVLKKIFQLF